MAGELQGKIVAFLVANDGVEQAELAEPWRAVQEAGGIPRLIAPEAGSVRAVNHLAKGDTFDVDETAAQADVSAYGALVLPGGVANPYQLRLSPEAVAFAKAFFDATKPVAVIGHGAQTLIKADVVRGRQLTSWPGMQGDLRDAGAAWRDEEVVLDNTGLSTLVSSRGADDLKAFCQTLVDAFAAA